VPDQIARKARFSSFRASQRIGLAAALLFFGSQSLESVIANGETRTLSFHHLHTGEDITITYKQDGKFDEAALEKLNWFMRDWRVGQPIKMDPYLFDLIWEVNREVGAKEPVQVVCGYRSPSTNAMLRASSRGVAQFSQHMLGKAIDFYIPGVELTQLREVGLKLQRGGVGFYPTSGWPFVHLDTGNVRHWPTVTREYLARLFPDGKTVHIPSDGRPMPGFQLALAEIQSRGKEVGSLAYASAHGDTEESDSGAPAGSHRVKDFFASIFNKKNANEGDDGKIAAVRPDAPATQPAAKPAVVASLASATGPQLQWKKGPDPVTAPANSSVPMPRSRPQDMDSNAGAAPLPLDQRKVASASDITAALPLAITGGAKQPSSLLSYAPEAVPQRASMPVTQETAASASVQRPRIEEVVHTQDLPRSPGLYGDAAHSPSTLFSKQSVQFTGDMRHPDQSGLAILLDPAATTAGYFAHQSGGKIVSSAY